MVTFFSPRPTTGPRTTSAHSIFEEWMNEPKCKQKQWKAKELEPDSLKEGKKGTFYVPNWLFIKN